MLDFRSKIIIICPTAIAYSMGQIINRFASVSQSVSVSVCPSVGTLAFAFLDRFSPKLAQAYEFVRGQYRTTLSPILFPPQSPF